MRKQKSIKKWIESREGSLTVEASLIMPVFLCMILFFVSFFQVMFIQEQVNLGLWEIAKEMSQYSYCYEYITKDTEKTQTKEVNKGFGLGQWLSGAWIGNKMNTYLPGKFLRNSCVVGKEHGITYTARAFQTDEEIQLVAIYKIRVPVLSFAVPDIPMVQQICTRGFVGTEEIGPGEQDEDDIYVYVTETGVVYHVNEECSHISLSIFSSDYTQVEELRNAAGGIYKSCEKCVKSEKLSPEQRVYLTEDGDKYHKNSNCSGLKRNVSKVKLSVLQGYSACMRCGQ